MMLIIAGLLMATPYRCAMSICINCSVVSEEGDSGATDWGRDTG